MRDDAESAVSGSRNGCALAEKVLRSATPEAIRTHEREPAMAVRDSNGNELSEGDSVQVIKDLKVKGSSQTLKRGTTFKRIHLTDSEEEVECRDGKSTLVLKAAFLKKA